MTQPEQEAVFRALATKAMSQIARDPRQRETSTEERLWAALRDRRLARLKFRRQHSMAGTAYVVDFLCYAARLVVKIDGSIHEQQIADDRMRQGIIEALGYKVIRFTNEDVLQDMQKTLVAILEAIRAQNCELVGDTALTPAPSPSGRGEKRVLKARIQEAPIRTKKTAPFQTDGKSQKATQPGEGSPLHKGEGLGVRARR